MNEEFYEYLMEIERMEKKTDKVIDIMKGKNKIEISPKISESVTGGVLIQDLEDYKPLEIETVDIVTPKRLNQSDWKNEMFDFDGEEEIEEGVGQLVSGAARGATRAGIKVGGKKGGRAVQKGGRAAAAKGRDAAAKAKEGNEKKKVGDGKYEKMGAKIGGVAGGTAGFFVPDGPAMVAGEIAGGLAGAKVGGKIGRQIDKFRAKKSAKKNDKKKIAPARTAPVKEETTEDSLKDNRMMHGGLDGNNRYPARQTTPANKDRGPKGKTPVQRETEKKYGKGASAMDIVRAQIQAKHGKGAIMSTKKTKKEHYDWRSQLI